MLPCWRTFQINLNLSDLFCCVFFPPLLLQYVISLSQKKPGLTNKKTAGKKNITNVYSTILKIFMDEGGSNYCLPFSFLFYKYFVVDDVFFFYCFIGFVWLVDFFYFLFSSSQFICFASCSRPYVSLYQQSEWILMPVHYCAYICNMTKDLVFRFSWEKSWSFHFSLMMQIFLCLNWRNSEEDCSFTLRDSALHLTWAFQSLHNAEISCCTVYPLVILGIKISL